MDDLIVTGLAGIIGLFVAGIILIAIAGMVVLFVAHAIINGNYRLVFEIIAGILVIVAVYSGIGLWLRKTGRI
ncbi:MAG: hypothetical protein ABFC71_08915 [Methanoregula sp.]